MFMATMLPLSKIDSDEVDSNEDDEDGCDFDEVDCKECPNFQICEDNAKKVRGN